ncbi:unnamed protein product [Parajaminaea phylloscopi]
MASLLAQGKGTSQPGHPSSFEGLYGSSSAALAAEQQSRPLPGGQSGLGPRAGFRTTNRDDGAPMHLAHNNAVVPSTFLSPQDRFSSAQALDAALHEAVRRESSSGLARVDAASHQTGTTGKDPLSPYMAQHLDPAYHEAWARSIPAPDLSSSHTLAEHRDHHELGRAWERAMLASSGGEDVLNPSQTSNPTNSGGAERGIANIPTAEQGGLLALLAAEEEEEARRAGISTENWGLYSAMTGAAPGEARADDAQVQMPPPDLQSIQSTDPREALAFILNDAEDEKKAASRKLDDLKRRLELDLSEDATGGHSAADAARRRAIRRSLAQIEYDVAVLERKLGYTEEVWLNEAREYPDPPDLAKVGEDEQGDDPSEEELGMRRRRAIERLESLRRHLEAKL